MAELILKVKRDVLPDPFYQDGDIICAINDRRIKDVHAQHICKSSGIKFKSDGRRPINELLFYYLSKVKEFKFERLSKFEVRRTNLFTLQEDLLSRTPNGNGESINVDIFIQRRLNHPEHMIFGEVGQEIWFGGNTKADHTKLDDIWNQIETRTGLLKANHINWPFTAIELKTNLVVKVDDFTEAEKGVLEAPVLREIITPEDIVLPSILKKRMRKVEWKDLPGIKVTDVLDSTKTKSVFDKNLKRASIVQVKV